ncbi:MAG: hypothetical protein LAT50_01520 [Ectothiorhodospiraceae bacterium]|nr:hypothetical protein [Ectothiorhodospiraceae bacterium]
MEPTQRQPGLLADLWLLLQAVHTRPEAERRARIAGRVVMLMGVIVVAFGVMASNLPTMLEGTLVTLLAFAGGWFYSRAASVILVLLMSMGLATSMATGSATARLLVQVAMFGVCLRLGEATFRRTRLPGTAGPP